ncbi:MAG: type II toxin-antitoxin system VapB family antitoxin [Candidatus Dormibacteria bacterium]
MGRTNIDLDDELVASAMRLYRVRTKREAVDLALRQLVGDPLTVTEALALEGSGWDADLSVIRGAEGPWS